MVRYLCLLLLLIGVPALAHIGGENMTTEVNKWADRQRSIKDIGCCGAGDAHLIAEDHLRMVNGDFEVLIEADWHGVGAWAMLANPLGDANPTGQAVVWYGPDQSELGGVRIYCFALPNLI